MDQLHCIVLYMLRYKVYILPKSPFVRRKPYSIYYI